MPKCEQCNFVGNPDEFECCFSAYHDFRCPKCGTTQINTEDINKEWAEKGKKYGCGDNNFLIMQYK